MRMTAAAVAVALPALFFAAAGCGGKRGESGDESAPAANTNGASPGASVLPPVVGGSGGSTVAAAGTGGTGGGAGAGVMMGGSGGSMAQGAAGAAAAGSGGSMAAAPPSAPSAGEPAVDASKFSIQVQLASDVQPSAPGTIGIVTWSSTLSNVADAHIEFGLDSTYGMQAPVDLSETDYRTLLLGMKPGRTYHFRVVASDGSASYASDDQTVDTGPATTAVHIGQFKINDETAYERGFIVASYWQGNGASVAFILDADGEIVWWHDFGVNGIARARMSASGKNMWMISPNNNGAPLKRVSVDSLDEQTYSNAIGSHDITPVSGELMAYLDYSENDCNSIFEIDPSGEPHEVFESTDYIGGGSSGGGLGGGLGGGFGGGGGGCHGNAVRYSQAEDVYTFSDITHDIFVLDRSGALQWQVSNILDGGIATYGGRQHGHQLLPDSILIFANGGGGANVSAAVEYSLDGQEIWRYQSGDYSANLGDVQRLPGGNTMVTFSNASVVHQVDPDGNVVMQFDGAGSNIGYTLWRPSLYGPPPDIE